MRCFRLLSSVTLSSVVLLASVTQAAIIVSSSSNNGTDTNFTPYTVSTTDLINGATAIASTGNFAVSFTIGLPVLTDGTFTIADDPEGRGAFADGGAGVGESVTYSLGGNPLGYNVSSIDVYGGWTGEGRQTQGYHVLYSTAANPSTYLPLAERSAFGPGGAGKIGIKTTISEDSLPFLATAVANLRFDFDVAVPNGWSGYAEIDVFGAPVPEPGSAGSLLIGGMVLGLRSARRPGTRKQRS